jgi:transposase
MANSDVAGGAAPDLPATGVRAIWRDTEWARLEPMIPPARLGGRPRKIDLRAAMNAILYLLWTGSPWRYPCARPRVVSSKNHRWQYTMTTVRKRDAEATFIGTCGNDRVAPIADAQLT